LACIFQEKKRKKKHIGHYGLQFFDLVQWVHAKNTQNRRLNTYIFGFKFG